MNAFTHVIAAIVISFAAIVPAYAHSATREGAVVWCYLS